MKLQHKVDMKAGIIKDLVDAIRDWVKGKLADITALFPSQASSSNQLADKAFVNSSVQTATANFRGAWENYTALPTNANNYPVDYAGNKTPTNNDYAVILDSSDIPGESHTLIITRSTTGEHDPFTLIYDGTEYTFSTRKQGEIVPNEIYVQYRGAYYWYIKARLGIKQNGVRKAEPGEWWNFGIWSFNGTLQCVCGGETGLFSGTWRMKYTGNWAIEGKLGWKQEYQVNEEPMTSAQVAAINSGITAELVQKLIAL